MTDTWPPPAPDPVPCPGGCGYAYPYTWHDGPRTGRPWTVGRWARPMAPLCDACVERRRLADKPDPWPPPAPDPVPCVWSGGCDAVLAYTWHDGPWDGPVYRRGRWTHPDAVLCPRHVQEHRRREEERQVQQQLAASGLPDRLQVYRWDHVEEYTDSAGRLVAYADRGRITHAAFQRYQANLPQHALGITPWNKSLARRLRALCDPDATVHSMVIMGPVGSGKSTLVAATLAGLLQRGVGCAYVTEADLWAMVRSQWGQVARKHHRSPDVVQALVDVPVLALDDLGTIESPRPWHVDGMERLVCGRYDAGRPLIVTTNHSLQDLADTYGERVGSRLVEMIGRGARYVRLGGPDWRTGLVRPDDPDDDQAPLPAPADAAPAPTPAPATPCPTCGATPCRCPCPECGYHPCRGGTACQ